MAAGRARGERDAQPSEVGAFDLTDVDGIRVGHAHDCTVLTGCSAFGLQANAAVSEILVSQKLDLRLDPTASPACRPPINANRAGRKKIE